jgi:hypothetical protein
VFYAANRQKLNDVPLTSSPSGVNFIRFTMLNPQVPTDHNPAAACTGPADCGTDPNDDSGVAFHCAPGADQAFGGCQFMDMSEIEIYGKPS